MIIFDALLECLRHEVGLSSEIIDKAKDLYSLTTIFEGNLSKIIPEREAKYIKDMNTYLNNGDLEKIKNTIPPLMFREYHRKLIKYGDIFKKDY